MSVTDAVEVATVRQLATEPATSRAWWFLGTLAVLRNPEGAPRTPAVIELTVPPGGSPPRHFHEQLDDAFLLLEGEVVVRSGDETVVARPGTYVVVPHGVEHTFRVTSKAAAKLLLVHADDSFLQFVESLGTPTTELVLVPVLSSIGRPPSASSTAACVRGSCRPISGKRCKRRRNSMVASASA